MSRKISFTMLVSLHNRATLAFYGAALLIFQTDDSSLKSWYDGLQAGSISVDVTGSTLTITLKGDD